MSDTGIAEQIATLREQIAAAEAEIDDRRSRLKAQSDGHAAEAEEELAELSEAHEFMRNRLRRLESCQQGFEL
jgi:uncharacterized protein involved in exopolysaccharide biosynthesis